MTVDWGAVLAGFGIGTVVSVLFFVGLVLGVRLALRLSRPTAILLPSSAVRIVVLLWAGWLVTGGGTDGWAFGGYTAAFFLVRFIATSIARVPRVEEV